MAGHKELLQPLVNADGAPLGYKRTSVNCMLIIQTTKWKESKVIQII